MVLKWLDFLDRKGMQPDGRSAPGHGLSIGVVVLIAGLAQVAVSLTYVRIGVAVALVAVYKLIRSRHVY